MTNITNEEIINAARAAKSPGELLETVKGFGVEEFSEENARAYFELLNRNGELSDDELENASGGGCTNKGRKVVSKGNVCPSSKAVVTCQDSEWQCKQCKKWGWSCTCGRPLLNELERTCQMSFRFNAIGVCGSCNLCIYENGLWICTNDKINNPRG